MPSPTSAPQESSQAAAGPPEDGGLGRRERKKRETRRAIARAALRLAQEGGPEVVTIDAISEAADVSPRTVFNHFASKEDAILAFDPTSAESARRRFAARPVEEPLLRSLRSVMLDASEQLAADLGDWRQRVRLVREHPATLYPRYIAAFAELERALVELVAERLGVDADEDLRPSLLVASALAAVRVATERWESSDRSVEIEDLIDDAFASLEAGLR